MIGDVVTFLSKRYDITRSEMVESLKAEFPRMRNSERCFNCTASMEEYVFHLDVLDALLVLGMGNIVKERVRKGMLFTEANAVHVQSMLNKYYSVPSRTTQCSKLGLIAKVKNKKGKHDKSRGWLITKRGFQFLRGEKVPAMVKVWRNEILEHFDELITIGEAFALGVRNDYKREFTNYRVEDWETFLSPYQEKLI
jgi:hypothetical protein